MVCGHSKLIKDFEKVISLENKEQLLSYDTTFQLGNFYVSVLLYRHVIFHKNPIIPVLFLIHERKLSGHHEILFRTLRGFVNFPRTRKIPIITDGEAGIIKAISTTESLVDLRCWNHLFQDIKCWLIDHGVERKERNAYKEMLIEILS